MYHRLVALALTPDNPLRKLTFGGATSVIIRTMLGAEQSFIVPARKAGPRLPIIAARDVTVAVVTVSETEALS